MNPPAVYILPLDATDASLEVVGGKGKSLATMAAAGFPVPRGFLLTTTAYRDFVRENRLGAAILSLATNVSGQDAASSESVSADIHALFEGAVLSDQVITDIQRAYAELGDTEAAVAVRSSATAEDLPDLSFAGQQETYLNVCGQEALLSAICRCWASLWTARAISYRHRVGMDHSSQAMAVVVQVMVAARVSGILFSANPTTGDRSEMVINAGFGLGEGIVGGHITPDTYVVERPGLHVKETVIGLKEQMVVPSGDQGTAVQTVAGDRRDESSLSEALLRELASLAIGVERCFGDVPQDIEWAVAGRKLWLLQSRPVTGLPPAPLDGVRWDPPYPGAKLIRRQVVENMPDPLSPLFAELYLQEGLEQSIDAFMARLGMPIDIGEFVTRPLFTTVNGYAYQRADYRFDAYRHHIPRILRWYVTGVPALFRDAIPHWRDEALPAYQEAIEERRDVDPVAATDGQLLSGIRALTIADAVYWFDVAIVMAMAKITDGLLHLFLRVFASKRGLTSGMFLSGFESGTMRCQEELTGIAKLIRAETALAELVVATPVERLVAALQGHANGGPVLAEIQKYLERYGHQIYNLDFAEPTQGEDPLPVLLTLQGLVGNSGSDTTARRTELVRRRGMRLEQTTRLFGPWRRWLFQKVLRWAQLFGPLREEALFYVGAAWPELRRLALELGRRLVEVGTLASPDDVFYLVTGELEEACRAREREKALPGLAETADDRRVLREARKRLHPPGMVPPTARLTFGPFDFSAFETQMRNPERSETLNGFAVSPGRVTAEASVVLSPADFGRMIPGTILVCPITTPAWTPLFAQARGLVTDIGGILAHGSIVAREYGIPAVLGTGNSTRVIVGGQQITVDGDRGTVTIR